MTHDVFISYSHHDKSAADAVCAKLEQHGIRCWIAPRDVEPGTEWAGSIIHAISNSKIMVLVFSKNANDSPQIRKEVERAVNKGVIVVPLRIEDVIPTESLEYFMSNVHWLDALTPPLENHLDHLAGTVKIMLERMSVLGPPRLEVSPPIAAPESPTPGLGRIPAREKSDATPDSAMHNSPLADPATTYATSAPPRTNIPQSKPSSRSSLSTSAGLVTLVLLIAMIVAIYFVRKSHTPPNFVREKTLPGDIYAVETVAFSPDGALLASGGFGGMLKIWDAASGNPVRTVHSYPHPVFSVEFSPDSRVLASASGSVVTLWDLATVNPLRVLPSDGNSGTGLIPPPPASVANICRAVFSRDGRLLAAGHGDSSILIWDPIGGGHIRTLPSHLALVTTLAFSPDGSLLAAGGFAASGNDTTVEVWNVATWSEVRSISGHDGRVYSVAFSPDGHVLASSGYDHNVILWNASTGHQLYRLAGHQGTVDAIAFSPDSRWLASGSQDRTIKIWNVSTGNFVDTLPCCSSEVDSVAFSPDGRQLASGHVDKTITLWRRTN
jgi:WD40 repeat protein